MPSYKQTVKMLYPGCCYYGPQSVRHYTLVAGHCHDLIPTVLPFVIIGIPTLPTIPTHFSYSRDVRERKPLSVIKLIIS